MKKFTGVRKLSTNKDQQKQEKNTIHRKKENHFQKKNRLQGKNIFQKMVQRKM